MTRSPLAPSFVMPANGLDGAAARRREIATLTDSLATVRLWIDSAGADQRLVIEDRETGEELTLSAAELVMILEGSDFGESWTVWRTG